jgi:hypothetical protein
LLPVLRCYCAEAPFERHWDKDESDIYLFFSKQKPDKQSYPFSLKWLNADVRHMTISQDTAGRRVDDRLAGAKCANKSPQRRAVSQP